MKIKRVQKRRWGRFLVEIGAYFGIILIFFAMFSFERIGDNMMAPNLKDGDLLIRSRFDGVPILMLRVRGFDD